MSADTERVVYAFGNFVLDPGQRVLVWADARKPVPLSPRVLDTLACLVAKSGELVDKSALMKAVWPDVVVEENSLSQNISALRRALGENAGEHRFIATIPGRGYQFVADVRVVPARGEEAPASASAGKKGEAASFHAPAAANLSVIEQRRAVEQRHEPMGRLALVAGVLLAAVGVAAFVAARRDETAPVQTPAARFEVAAPNLASFGWVVAISPDGRTIVYARGEGSERMLFRRRIDELEATPIRGTEGGTTPFFSPDSEWLGFFADGLLKKVALAGGDPITVAETENRRQIVAERLDTGERYVLFNGTNPHYLRSGHIVFMRQDSDALWAVPFDLKRLAIAGEMLPVLTGVRIHTANAAHFAVADDGTLVYVPGTLQSRQGRLILKDRAGPLESLIEDPEGFPRSPRLSPDGTLLAADFAPPGEPADPSIWIYDLASDRPPFRLTPWGGSNRLPTWTPDGQHIAFQWTRAEHGIENGVFLVAADGSERPEYLAAQGAPLAWSRDGTELVFAKDTAAWQRDLWVVSVVSHESRPLIATEVDEDEAAISPDGEWIAYVSNPTGRREVYVQPYPEGGPPLRVSQGGGHEPVWSRDGTELYYQSGSRLMSASAERRDARLRFSTPRVLFEGGFLPYTPTITLTERTNDVAPDGRFVMIDLREEQANRLVVVQRWADEVARRGR